MVNYEKETTPGDQNRLHSAPAGSAWQHKLIGKDRMRGEIVPESFGHLLHISQFHEMNKCITNTSSLHAVITVIFK
jgi:hypothetical protein